MARPPFDIAQMFTAAGIVEQILQATDRLADELEKAGDDPGTAKGRAFEICENWQRRFEQSLCGEVPEWGCLAGLRCITDYTIPPENLDAIAPDRPAEIQDDDCPEAIDTVEKWWRAKIQCIDEGRPGRSKFNLRGDLETYFLQRLTHCDQLLGGQAGNINWLWHSIGAYQIAYVPYLADNLLQLASINDELAKLRFLRFHEGGSDVNTLAELADERANPDAANADIPIPSGGSVVLPGEGRRVIYQFAGMRPLVPPPKGKALAKMTASDWRPWKRIKFYCEGRLIGSLEATDDNDITWPSLPLFCRWDIERCGKWNDLIVTIADDKEIRQALEGRVSYAVLGGIDKILVDGWLRNEPELRTQFWEIAEQQVRAVAASGIRVGVELSGVPAREYASFIGRLCRQGVIAALGINGEDELPDVVGAMSDGDSLELSDFGPGPPKLPSDLRKEGSKLKCHDGEHFEYITFVRARRLADATGVRTLYVHTTTLDFILMKDAAPGALLHAQLGDMMGKGFVIGALLRRAYGDGWMRQLDKMTPAVKPEAVARLARFAKHFADYELSPGALDLLLGNGYWLAPSPEQYSLAVVPVMWPAVAESGSVATFQKNLNPTGSGDMTFGAFFFLSGV